MSGRAPGIPLPLPRTAGGRPILSRSDLDHYDPRPQRSGRHERFYCPIHGSDHQRSLSLDPVTGLYICFACGARGMLRDYWPDADKARRAEPEPPRPIDDIGRDELERQAEADVQRGTRLSSPLPSEARAFLRRLPSMNAALRDPDCPGVVYLRARGLDPLLAADLGVGYAAPGMWPGDRGRKVGRVVYPLADPGTGRLVSAIGRLCIDPDGSWPEDVRAAFKQTKQRKLAGCPAGVWPYQSLAAARAQGHPLVLVEGPADVLALKQQAPRALHVLALVGTANVLPVAAVRDLPGVVIALDADGSGAQAMADLQYELILAGLPVEMMGIGWLGAATDPGDLAAALARAIADGDSTRARAVREQYERAVDAVWRACTRIRGTAWDVEAATRAIAETYERCAALLDRDAGERGPEDLARIDECDKAIDAACAACDWGRLQAALAAYEQAVRASLPSAQ